LQELNQLIGIKLLTSVFFLYFWFLIPISRGRKCPFLPPPADAHVAGGMLWNCKNQSIRYSCCPTRFSTLLVWRSSKAPNEAFDFFSHLCISCVYQGLQFRLHCNSYCTAELDEFIPIWAETK